MSSEVAPKRALGQHFLVDPNILRVIGRLAELDESDVVLEIGPGLGVLTTFLADRVKHVHAVEIDRTLESRAAGGARRSAERRSHLRRRVEARPVGVAAKGDEARLQPPVQRRRRRGPRHSRTHAVHPALVRDGAEGGRRAALRSPRVEGVRRSLGAGAALGEAHGLACRVAHGVPAAAPRRLDARGVRPAAAAAWTSAASRTSCTARSPTVGRRFPTRWSSQVSPPASPLPPRSPSSVTAPRLARRSWPLTSSSGLRSYSRDDSRRTGKDQPRARGRASPRRRQARARDGVRANPAGRHAVARAIRRAGGRGLSGRHARHAGADGPRLRRRRRARVEDHDRQADPRRRRPGRRQLGRRGCTHARQREPRTAARGRARSTTWLRRSAPTCPSSSPPARSSARETARS